MDNNIEFYTFNAVVVGTGAAGFNSALRLRRFNVENIAIVTNGITMGTSRNTGSDKQTYYKISMEGDSLDSIEKMAQTYFDGKSMDGEHALIEAAYSSRCFFNLVELGVPFPKNNYGEYVGYKTDHDPCTRATSIGPYTSKKMTECLENAVIDEGVMIFDGCQLVKILVENSKTYGIICYSHASNGYKVFISENVIIATGGPAGMYKDSVYPESQIGSSGVAFECGVKGKNLTEWQCGLASVSPRWNVSGSYMQVIPRFVSTKEDLSDENEFLLDFFSDKKQMNSMIFLKGYQWPFDVRKVMSGSSIIDILVYIENVIKKRRVFIDFRTNTEQKSFDVDELSAEALAYLGNADVLFGTPIERLEKMNYPAYQLYLDKGVDLEKEMLEIALCVQHNNGGLSVDSNWETNISGLYAVGEVAGTHGVYRPGGSALNAGQVGSLRAAECISRKKMTVSSPTLMKKAEKEVFSLLESVKKSEVERGKRSAEECWLYFRSRMSEVGSAIRDADLIKGVLEELRPFIEDFYSQVKIEDSSDCAILYDLKNLVFSQYVYLSAFFDYISNGPGSRGSALYHDVEGKLADARLPETFRFVLASEKSANSIQEIRLVGSNCMSEWRATHPIPQRDNFFENVWKEFRGAQ